MSDRHSVAPWQCTFARSLSTPHSVCTFDTPDKDAQKKTQRHSYRIAHSFALSFLCGEPPGVGSGLPFVLHWSQKSLLNPVPLLAGCSSGVASPGMKRGTTCNPRHARSVRLDASGRIFTFRTVMRSLSPSMSAFALKVTRSARRGAPHEGITVAGVVAVRVAVGVHIAPVQSGSGIRRAQPPVHRRTPMVSFSA